MTETRSTSCKAESALWSGKATESTVWNPQKAKWLANVESYVAKLGAPAVVDVDEHRKLREQLEGTQAALKDSEGQRRELDSRLKAAAAAASSPEQRRALLPANEVDRFKVLVKNASAAIRKAGTTIGDVLFAELAHGAMDWPDAWNNRDRIDELRGAIEQGDLVETSDERLRGTPRETRALTRSPLPMRRPLHRLQSASG